MAEQYTRIHGPLYDRGGAFHNARSYGAVADGVANDAPALNDAATEAAATSKHLHIPAGRYFLGEQLDLGHSGLKVTTAGAETVFVTGNIASGIAISIEGTSLAYLSDIHIGGFKVERTSGNGAQLVRIRYVEDSTFGDVWGEGTGGGLLSLRDLSRCRFGWTIGKDLGSPSAAVLFTRELKDCQFEGVIAYGNTDEGLDFFNNDRCQVGKVIGIDLPGEVFDMGNCRHCQIREVIAYNCAKGFSLKVENATGGGSYGNQIDRVIAVDCTLGMSCNNSPASPSGTEVQSRNQIGQVHITSTVASSTGLTMTGTVTNPRMADNQIDQLYISVDGLGLEARYHERLRIGQGYVESASGQAIDISEVNDLEIPGKLDGKGAAGGTSTKGVVNLQAIAGLDVNVGVAGASSGVGLSLSGCRRGSARVDVRECSTHGLVVEVAGGTDAKLHVSGQVYNVNKSASTFSGVYHSQTGTGTAEGVHLQGLRIYDTQATKTTRGLRYVGAWDRGSILGCDLRGIASDLITGTLGDNYIVRDNFGLQTENSGVAVPASSVKTVITVSHGCALTPKIHQISVTPIVWGSATQLWISNVTATSFDINFDTAPGGAGEFGWQVVRSKVGT